MGAAREWGTRHLLVGIAAMVLAGAAEAQVPVTPTVTREGETPPGLVPGAGAFIVTGPAGAVRVDHDAPGPIAPAAIDAAAAVRIARAFADLGSAVAHPVPVALASRGERRWGYAVDLVEATTWRAVRVYVDGDGRPVGQVPLSKSGLASVFDRSPDDGELYEVQLVGLGEADQLESAALDVKGCIGVTGIACEPHAFAAPDADGNWYFDPVPSDPFDPFVEVNAWHHLEAARRWLATIGLDTLPRRVAAVVNFRLDVTGDGRLDPFPNAFYLPRMSPDTDALVFGHVGAGSLALDADVLRHELVHAATVPLADLWSGFDDYGYDHQPSVIAEAVADYFAAALSEDPAIGVHAGRLLGWGEDGLRRLDLDLSCPDDLVGRPHADAEVFGGALWQARAQVGPMMDRVVAAALKAMPHQPSLVQAARAIAAAAVATLPQADARIVEAILDETGISTCSRFRPLEASRDRMGWISYTRQMGRLSPGPFQYRIDVPENVERLRITLETPSATEQKPVLHVRAGAPVKYLRDEMAGRISFEIVADHEGREAVVVDAASWDFLEDAVVFVSPAGVGEAGFGYRISVDFEAADARPALSAEALEPSPSPRTLPPADAGPPAGCGERAPMAAFLFAFAAVLRCRSRRTRDGRAPTARHGRPTAGLRATVSLPSSPPEPLEACGPGESGTSATSTMSRSRRWGWAARRAAPSRTTWSRFAWSGRRMIGIPGRPSSAGSDSMPASTIRTCSAVTSTPRARRICMR